MKKLLTTVLTMVLICSLAVTALAAGFDLDLDHTAIQAGEAVTATISLEEAIPDAGQLQMVLGYNWDILQYTSHTLSEGYAFIGNDVIVSKRKPEIKASWLDLSGGAKNLPAGTVISVVFTAKETVEVKDIPMTVKAVVNGSTISELAVTVRICPGHSFGDWYVTKEATCTTDGEEGRECSICGYMETRATVSLAHSYDAVVTAPTCTEQGYTTHTCVNCGDSYVDTYVDALGHSFTQYVSDENATCVEDGTETAKCDRCDVTDTRVLRGSREDAAHSFPSEYTSDHNATCTADGTKSRICALCGEKETVTDIGSATGHTYGSWYTAKEATCTADGEEKRNCVNCDQFETQVIKAIGHDYKSVVTAPTCAEQGYTTHTCANCGHSYADSYVDALGHTFVNYVSNGDATCTEDGTKTAKCSRCDVTDTVADAGSAKGHSYGNWYTAKEATCTADGEEKHDCVNCDASETRAIEATGHDYKAVVTAPTCTEQGYTTHTCANCGHSYVDSYVDATGHSYGDWYVTKEATCTADGEEKHDCANCDASETRAIEAIGHDYKAVVTAPTCTEQGYTTHTCENCGHSYADSYVDALGHDFAGYVSDGNATCTEDGTKTAKCSRCDVTDTIPDRGSATGHTYGDWYVTKEATCTADGEEKHDCVNCDASETRAIEATGHDYKAVVTAPTCTEQGYTTHTCANCGHSYVDSYVPATGHAWDEGVVTKEPTETETGTLVRTCTICGAKDTVILPTLDHEHNYQAEVTAPTCTEQGYTTHICACGDSYVDSYVPATGHSYGDWYVTTEATCTADGEEKHDCVNCDHYETRVIKATGHDYEAVVTAPTCTERGYTTHTCANCGHSYVDSYVDALGHRYENGICTGCGQAEPDGLLGDVNGDGEINTTDAYFIVMYYIEKMDLDEAQLLAADVDGNGKVDTTDAYYIVMYYTEQINAFPGAK